MKLEISSNQLSVGAQSDDVVRVHRALQSLGRAVPLFEAKSRLFGSGSAAVVKALQQELDLPPSGMVDTATVQAINGRLEKLPTDARVVRGSVRVADGRAFDRGFVQILGQSLNGEQVLGKSPLRDGAYQISYRPPPEGDGRVDLRVAVFDDSGQLETTPSGASILTNAGSLEVVDFVLSGETQAPSVEFEILRDELKRLLGAREFADLEEDRERREVSLLASQSGYSTDQVAALVLAHKLAQGTRTPVAVFYGLLRQGLPRNANALHAVDRGEQVKALQAAVGRGLVPKEIAGKPIEDHLADFAPEPPEELRALLGHVLRADELAAFVTQHRRHADDPDAFWREIEADPVLGNRAAELKFAVQLGVLTNDHVPLIRSLRALPDVNEAADLVRLNEEQWKALIQAEGVGAPAGTPGATSDEKVTTYARHLLRQVEAAFPSQFFAERLGGSGVAGFLKAQPAYDLRRTYPEQFFKQHPEATQLLSASDQQQLRAYQRLYRMTENTAETLALAAKGVHSAQQIARMDREVFAAQHADILPPGRAGEVHDRARQVQAAALALFAEHATALNRTGLEALPKSDSAKQAALAAESIPDWPTLFGTFDLCACKECASVHGPAAYLVDLLQFLDERQAREPLFERRPDLGDLELSCENANTPLPMVDLVNEILEDAVAPPPAFAPQTLAPALEADLAQAVATPALAGAFHPPLQPGARLETVEAGKRWRVWDEAFVYAVAKEGTEVKVELRSRQTTGSAAERRATPQYRNSAAYAELSQAVHPWTLPFELPRKEAEVFLTHLGVARRELIEALRPTPEPFDPNAPVVVRLAAERLGLSDTERRILVGEPLTPPRTLEDFWGGATVAQLAKVQALLDRSGLKYAELAELATAWFVNPTGSVKIVPAGDALVDTSDTTQLELTGATAPVLARLHRFVRLWRKLGWTIQETDRALRALDPTPNAPTLTNETLVRLDHLRTLGTLLRLPATQAIALWKPIDTVEPGSLYRSLFYNPAVFKPQDDVFRLRPDGRELAHTNTLLADQAAALRAAFRLSEEGFTFLLAKTNGRLNLANLSLIHRHALLARQVGLSVEDLSTAIELTGLNPFQTNRSQEAIRLVEAVRAMRTSGFNVPLLDYLLRQPANPAAGFAPEEAAMMLTLKELRDSLLAVEAPSEPERQALRRSAVIDRVAAALGLPADVAGALLGYLSHGGVVALQRLMELSEIEATPRVREDAEPQFAVLDKLLKIASIIRTLSLPSSQMDWLFRENEWLAVAPDPPADAIPFADWFSLIELPQLRRELRLQDAALEAILRALTAVAVAEPAERLGARNGLIETLMQWLGWATADLEVLIGAPGDLGDLGLLNAQVPGDYRLNLLLRLQRAMRLLKRLGVGAAEASSWCEAVVGDSHARAIRAAAKAKHDEPTWQQLAAPLQNVLRDQQREALVGYLAARPQQWNPAATPADARALYSHFLIDVEMSSCQLTSRLKQALGSVQLFAQRCLLGLEPEVPTNDPQWAQWEWMKNYRVWEANRKIWLYPENWIEPQLRDHKTPFFKELEDELLQGEVTDGSAEQALRSYLEKLDEVARLEIVGAYEDDETKDLHVFGRTFHLPHRYYYRCREGRTKTWRPWERVELDIEGNHLIPVLWNRKLMVIWPMFAEKAYPKDVEMPPQGHKLTAADRYWEIQLAWSEYQNGRWSGKNVSEPVAFEAYQGEDDVLFGPRVAAPANTTMFRRRLDEHGPAHSEDPEDGPVADPGDSPPPAPARVRRLVGKELLSFKALVQDDTLVVRGFLRRDYRNTPAPGDEQIACCFGEFRFFGCRKIVTTAHRGQISGLNFPLAPGRTKFENMGFTGTGDGLSLFDGTFPVSSLGTDFGIQDELGERKPEVNEREPIIGTPDSTVENKIPIHVLDRTPWPFRLLAPHQDLQFIGDRPFFFMDDRRAFLVTSTGGSGKGTTPDLGGWVRGDLAVTWRADYFPAADGPVPPVEPQTHTWQSFTVLAPGPNGRRAARKLPPVELQPVFRARTRIPIFYTTREYRFANFHHPYLCEFVKSLSRGGLPALLSLDTQETLDTQSSEEAYQPRPRALMPHPVDEVEFQVDRAYALYNWELFFHIPLLIADHLSKNQRFAEAQRWFHFVFDPTGVPGGDVPQRYWRTKPFHERMAGDYEAESVRAIEKLVAGGLSPEWAAAVSVWRDNPFSPHAVARLRTTAYQKTVVMKYLDNLIAWGDQLFRRDTIETINEATQLYVLAAELLGRRPEVIERPVQPAVKTFNRLAEVGLLGNSLEEIELLVAHAGGSGSNGQSSETPDLPSAQVLYFCVPENEKLLGYWDTVADRLFKIRHCMNIEGQARQLPLFEPPIDPALLVRARAAGLSIGEVLRDITVPLPHYRFAVMLQKANELAAEVRNLGAALLSALEKKDAEALSTLRAGQEVRLLEAVRDVRKQQVEEAKAGLAALEASRQMTQARKDYYDSREFISEEEQASRGSLLSSRRAMEAKFALHVLIAILAKKGTVKLGSATTAGIEVGGNYLAAGLTASAEGLATLASRLSTDSQLEGRMAEFQRRKDEWDHQANLATIELKQLEQQMAAAGIRLAIAERELRNHDLQTDNAREVDEFLRTKFTNQELHQWMAGQISGIYFQSYQLAYDFAKRAEQCLRFELGVQESSYVKFGYWDSLKKGLLAGERLQYDLRRLEAAYLEQNRREFELSKHISLLLLDPLALVQLRETGRCEFRLPEEIFDLDYPGHYFRRIKSVSLTLPCVTGPYTTIACTLRLLRNSIRINTDGGDDGYARNTDEQGSPAADPRFVENNIPVKAIATSNAQNDSGVFELSFRDERYLPFEGAGAVSEWALELFSDAAPNNPDPTHPDFGRPLRQFDYRSIADAVLHVKYTAREEGGAFKDSAIAHLRDYWSKDETIPALRLFDLRQEFPNEWHRFLHPTNPADGNVFELGMAADLFPIRDGGKRLQVSKLWVLARCTDPGEYGLLLTPPPSGAHTLNLAPLDLFGGLHVGQKEVATMGVEVEPTGPPAVWRLRVTRPGGGNLQDDPVKKSMEVEDLFLVLGYVWE